MSATFDLSMYQLDRSNGASNGDKIAEAEALAAEALRMANEAKRAAERLAEVKATLAMFSKKLDKVERYVEASAVEKKVADEATPFEADKAAVLAGATPVVSASSPTQPKPETPLRKKVDAPIKATEAVAEDKEVATVEEFSKGEAVGLEEPVEEDEPVEEEEPVEGEDAAVEEPVKEVTVPAAPALKKKVTIKEPPVTKDRARAPATVAIIPKEEFEKEFFEAALDSMGLDRACGVEDESVYAVLRGVPAPAPKKARARAPATVALIPEEEFKKEYYEAALDSMGLDRACGVEDASVYAVLRGVPAPAPKKVAVKKTPAPKTVAVEATPAPKKVAVKEIPAKKTRKNVSVAPQAPTSTALIAQEDVEKDYFEAALDSIGLDTLCGVDDATINAAMGLKKGAVLSSKASSKASSPAPAVVTTPQQIVPVGEGIDKDLIEAVLDSIGLDKMCGIDDVTLGFAEPPIVVPEPEPEPVIPTPFVNPTKVVYVAPVESLNPQELIHTESIKEKRAKQQREEQHLQQQNFQKSPTNNDFSDPFGADHDYLVFCGAIADVCEPDMSALIEPDYVAKIEYPEDETLAAESSVKTSEPPAPILKKATEDVKEDELTSQGVDLQTVESPMDETAQDVVSLGAEPEGIKTEEEHLYEEDDADAEIKVAATHTSAKQVVESNVKEVKSAEKPFAQEDIAKYYIHDQDNELLQLVDQHIWCV